MRHRPNHPHSSSRSSTTTASQAWAILARHARDEMAPLRLHELCQDNERVSSLVTVHNTRHHNDNYNNMVLVDLSRQRMTLETWNHLLRLASCCHLSQFITRLAWGSNNPSHPVVPQSKQKNNPSNSHTNATNTTDTNTTAVRIGRLPSLHLSGRVPSGQGYEQYTHDGVPVLPSLHAEWDKIEHHSHAIRNGIQKGVTGQVLQDVVVVGSGVVLSALPFVEQALQHDTQVQAETYLQEPSRMMRMRPQWNPTTTTTQHPSRNRRRRRRLHCLSTMDVTAAQALLQDLDPATTLVISWALQGNEETGLATQTLKTWLLQSLNNNNSYTADVVLAHHMILITGNDHISKVINKPSSVYLIPEHSRCDAFLSCSVACLLPLAIVFGWPVVQDFLAGAHDMDQHFVETNPRHNLPVLLALTDVWNETLLGTPTRVSIPCSPAWSKYPAFCATLESQTGSRSVHHNYNKATSSTSSHPSTTSMSSSSSHCPALVIDGGTMTGAYDRLTMQSPIVLNTEMLVVLDHQINESWLSSNNSHNPSRSGHEARNNHLRSTQDAALCSIFAHVDELAFGTQIPPPTHPLDETVGHAHNNKQMDDLEATPGNRPSTLLLVGKLDAFACGQLVALEEHRAVVKAHICGTDPFVREVGAALRGTRTDHLLNQLHIIRAKSAADCVVDDGETITGANASVMLSTKTILEHYARHDR